jgi:sec-independent protein translocase protein TatA
MIGTTEILIICGVVVLLFGATAIPKFAKNIGKAKSEFEKGVKEGSESVEKGDDEDDSSKKNSDKKESSKE